MMIDALCDTSCREDLMGHISRKIDREGMWKLITLVTTVFVTVLGISYAIYFRNVDYNEMNIRENTRRFAENSVKIETIRTELNYLKEGQKTLADKMDKLIVEVKEQKRR